MDKKMLRPLLVFLTIGIASAAVGQTFAEVRRNIVDGDYTTALSSLKKIEAKEPKNPTVNMLMGECYMALDRNRDAIKAYETAHKKGDNDALLPLMEIAVGEYRVDDADELLDTYREGLKKGRKTLPDNSGDIVEQLERTRNMLDRVEKIVVIDSILVDADDFFTHYRLSSASGTLNPTSMLPDHFDAAIPTVVYQPESRREILWAMPDSAENFRLCTSSALYGGEWEQPTMLSEQLNEGGDANFPFLMPDGITLYYANNGENSLGGYDIFISRRDGNNFLQPQNLGMPYNSPYDDYMLAIDEMTGVGWWATDRNRIEDMVTIYLFIPADMRINVPVDDPDLISRARLTSIKSTWEPGADYSDLLERVATLLPSGARDAEQFMFALPGGKVYTRVEQFRNNEARIAMRQYLQQKKAVDEARKQLASLRAQYAAGDRSIRTSEHILTLEDEILNSHDRLKELSNEIIKLENR